MNKTLITIICIILIILLGVFIGLRVYEDKEEEKNNIVNNIDNSNKNTDNLLIEVSDAGEEKTTPNTLIIYKTYYTKCKHYIKEYEDIDASLVNLSEEELKQKNSKWDIEKFSAEEIEMSTEEEAFCNQHYRLKLENNVIVIYKVDENAVETEYEQTGITTEYLTEEDILKLTSGIYIYGKENLTSTIEDYE